MTFGGLGQWRIEGAIALLALCLVAEIWLFNARAHDLQRAESRRSDLGKLSDRLDRQPHECIPLGWYPAGKPARGYYPDYNADVSQRTGVFQSGWTAVVRPGGHQTEVVDVENVLDELARVGLLERKALPDGVHYTLTDAGWDSYYERNDLGNNVEEWPFVCFSHLHTTRIAWSGPPAQEKGQYYVSRRVRFSWTSQVDAPWLTPFLKAHAVELPPVSNPADVEARRYVSSARWQLNGLDFEFGLVEHRSAWMAGR